MHQLYSNFCNLTLLSLRSHSGQEKMQSLSGEFFGNSIHFECLPEALHPIWLLQILIYDALKEIVDFCTQATSLVQSNKVIANSMTHTNLGC